MKYAIINPETKVVEGIMDLQDHAHADLICVGAHLKVHCADHVTEGDVFEDKMRADYVPPAPTEPPVPPAPTEPLVPPAPTEPPVPPAPTEPLVPSVPTV